MTCEYEVHGEHLIKDFNYIFNVSVFISDNLNYLEYKQIETQYSYN